MRLAADVAGTRKVVIEIIQLCYEAKAWKTLNEQILLLSKRRSQLKQVSLAGLSVGVAPLMQGCEDNRHGTVLGAMRISLDVAGSPTILLGSLLCTLLGCN